MYKVLLEWDFGQDDVVFSLKSDAMAWIRQNVDLKELSGEFSSHEEIFEAGLASIESVKLWRNWF